MARSRILLCALMLACAPLLFVTSLGARQRTPAAGKQPLQSLTVTVPGRPLVDLGAMWQFHPGDDPRWAEPEFDDFAWGAISTDKGWDKQGYSYIGGFGWYRRHVHYASPAAAGISLALNAFASPRRD